ncbi:MAG: phospho-sugar mutase, partial [Cytophagales bacterium]
MDLLQQSKQKAAHWLNSTAIDAASKEEIKNLLADSNPKNLIDSFYKDLEFGTGGLRGIMGVGANCINQYTIGAATQGLANYLKKSFANQEIKVAIAYDSRNNSQALAQNTANVFSANCINVHLFPEFSPTPQLS